MLKISTHRWKRLGFRNDTPITWLVIRYAFSNNEAAQAIFLTLDIVLFGLETRDRNRFDNSIEV